MHGVYIIHYLITGGVPNLETHVWLEKFMLSRTSTKALAALTLSCSILALGSAAQAQGVDEIIVTATKKAKSMQDIGTSVTAFTGDQVKELGFQSATDVVAHTPNLSFAQPLGEGNNAIFSMRGVSLNDFAENNEGPVAVYTDEVYMATLAGLAFQTYDVERVEVLRGPQGTLFGRNSTGGLVHYITKRPTEETEGYVNLTYGSHNQVRAEGAVGGALSENTSARLSGFYNTHDPYVENRIGRDSNEANAYGGRLQLAFEPSDQLSINLKGTYGQVDTVAPTFQHTAIRLNAAGLNEELPIGDINPICAGLGGLTGPGQDCFGYRDTDGDPYANDIDRNDVNAALDVKTVGLSGKIEWKGDKFDIVSITAFDQLDKVYGEDTDVGPVPAFNVSNFVDSTQFSQEFRISGETSAADWLAGVFYFDREVDGSTELDQRGIAFSYPQGFYVDETQSIGVFGRVDYQLSEKVSIIAGARYSQDKKDYDYFVVDSTGITATPPAGVAPEDFRFFEFNGSTAGDLASQKADLWSYHLELDYEPTDDILLYASASQGTKGPGYTNGTLGFFGPEPFDGIGYGRERLRSYEAGIKSILADGLARFNASAFYYDYDDFQAFTFVGGFLRIVNQDASIKGLEAELVTSPIKGLDLTFGGALLDTDFASTGNDLALAPSVSFNAIGRYEWEMASGMMAVQADYTFTGKQYFGIGNDPSLEEGGFGILGARLSYMPTDSLDISIWAKNLTDTEYRSYAVPVDFAGFQQNMIGRPQWLGATLDVSF